MIQGNTSDELPEHVLAASRLYRVELAAEHPFGAHHGAASADGGHRMSTEGAGPAAAAGASSAGNGTAGHSSPAPAASPPGHVQAASFKQESVGGSERQ